MGKFKLAGGGVAGEILVLKFPHGPVHHGTRIGLVGLGIDRERLPRGERVVGVEERDGLRLELMPFRGAGRDVL